MHDFRRNDYDVTNSVQVSSTASVAAAVRKLFHATWPRESFDRVERAFEDFEALFSGNMPGYLGVDTVYHDRQHTLDMTLTMMRLLAGYERSAEEPARFGGERGAMGLVTSLFHDAGYIRETTDTQHRNGAEFTLCHVTRSARFIAKYLPQINMQDWIPISTRVVHFTGYEVQLDQIHLDDRRDRKLGHLLGTADLVTQFADRCYLEKCRDRLYPEFVLAGIATAPGAGGAIQVKYGSGLDLLRQTPHFVRIARTSRLESAFEHAYRYIEPLFGGRNPYMEAIDRNLSYLDRVLRSERWPLLRRRPPLFTSNDKDLEQVRGLMVSHLKAVWA
jgi:hypothetical protein